MGRGLGPRRFHGIRFRLGLWLAFALLPLLILGGFQAQSAFRAQDAGRRADLQQAAERNAADARARLDTTGILLITDDGQWSHRISSPKHECAKTYRAFLADPVEESAIAQFAEGVMLRGEKLPTKPAELVIVTPTECLLTIHEGRYHQVKRMFAAIGNKVEQLHREQIGDLMLADDLAEGEYRALTAAEIAAF